MRSITINAEKCRRDGLCAAVCPLGIIALRGKKEVPQPLDDMLRWCIGCGHCVAVCPTGALDHSDIPAKMCAPLMPDRIPDSGQVEHFLRSRRSIRRFKPDPPDRDTLQRIIAMAGYAPSGHNRQPVHWTVFDKREDVHRLAELTAGAMRHSLEKGVDPGQRFMFEATVTAWDNGRDVILHEAPCLVAAHCRKVVGSEAVDASVALATMNLAAHSLGLGCCWAGLFMMTARHWQPLLDFLHLPDGHHIYGAMMVGTPKYTFQRMPHRKSPVINWR